ncbi:MULTISPECIES: ABC transporter ATP-binding protein [Pontibacillus]|uniref:ABC transporter ATP-binding protein n=1 Tax=Pontibacillus chungwhensis TaxID=265426 RepID=A0ABY8UYG8_9BACI|nr:MULTISPECIES: ABC transporter ATP-binding protein [Pontibacillus]MCD5325708.1 ABC transporter ATP-binding protein/permease [Pontibacillus sp. HN14]WIF98052.1 ABC transporter ATP-binding protein [Pontibacillus chungwhensis]
MSRTPIKSHPHARMGQKPPKINDMGATLKRIWKYVAQHKGLFILVMLMVLISSGLSLVGPYVLGLTVDRVIEKVETGELIQLFIGLGAIYLFQMIALILQNYWMIGVSQHTVYSMREHLFAHLQKLSLSYFQKQQHGELMSRLTNDMENVSRTLNSSIIQFTTSILVLIGTIGMMIWLSPILTLLTLIIVPVLVLGMKWITKRTSIYFKDQQRHLGDLNGYIEESLSGHSIIKLFSREKETMDEFNEKNAQLKTAGYWAQTYTGFIPKLMNMLNNVSFAIIVGAGGYLAVKGSISVGVIVTFTTYSRQFTRPLNDLANQFNMILSAVAGAERVFQVMDEAPEAKEGKESRLTNVKGDVRFESVSFAYEEDQATLHKIDLHAKPGDTVALVGPTGAGKTTIISLLLRFYDPDQGRILVDQKDTKQITRESLRTQMAVVLQDSFLFETSIRENIRYGKLDATNEEVEKAAQEANAHSFICKLPDGYDTILQSSGASISQGQKQLLSIARAMIKDPAILILDEATSSIDTLTEMKINDALKKLMKGRTSFVIAHRLHTIYQADQIVVLQNGSIIERGTHDQLVSHGGFYRSLVDVQFGQQVVE